MKIKDIIWNVTEEEYRADKALSYSTIAKYQREGFECLKYLFESVETPSLQFGSIVDTLLTSPEEFDNKYAVCNIPILSDSLMEIAKDLSIYKDDYNSIEEMPESLLSEMRVKHNYYANDKYKAVGNKKIKEECKGYFQMSKRSSGRTIISTEEMEKAVECKTAVLRHPVAKKFFSPVTPFENKEILYQAKLKGTYEDVELRCMFDILYVDHNRKHIIPVDLKTSYAPEYKFVDSYLKWHYFIQSNLYTYILKQNIDKYEDLKDYKISPYYFIVVSKNTLCPMIWKDESSLEINTNIYPHIENTHWKITAKELWELLNQKTLPLYPKWVKPINSITEKINERKSRID